MRDYDTEDKVNALDDAMSCIRLAVDDLVPFAGEYDFDYIIDYLEDVLGEIDCTEHSYEEKL